MHMAQLVGKQEMDSISEVFSNLSDSVKRNIPIEKEKQAVPFIAFWISRTRKTRSNPP